MNRRNILRLATGGVILAATAGAASQFQVFGVPDTAIAAWRDVPGITDIRRFVLAHALLAPNPHNMQPWIADLATPDAITLRLDPARLLPATDPFGRQILMGAGAFLELLAMAAAARGHKADISLFPDGTPGERLDARPFAHIRLLPAPSLAPDPLFAAIYTRRTDRSTYDPARPPNAEELTRLAAASAGLPVCFGTSGPEAPARTEAIRSITRAAWKTELTTDPAIMESFYVLRIGSREIDQHRDGIAITSPMLVALTKTGLFDRSVPPAPDSQATTSQIADFDRITAATPAYLWLVTEGNTRPLQIDAGRADARINVAGVLAGLVMHPNQQALQEYPQVASHHHAIHTLLDAPAPSFTVQMLARLGRLPPGTAIANPALRRGLAALIA